jgi:hypothetical protein
MHFLVHRPEGVGFITGRSVLIFQNLTLVCILSKLFVFQAIYRRACDEGLARLYRTSPVVKRIIKLIISLASYPQNKYMPGLWYKQFCNFFNASFNFPFVDCFVFQAIQQENAADLQ